MKKTFLFMMFAATMLVAGFTACSNDENQENSENESLNGLTEFSSGTSLMEVTDAKGMTLGDGTRTSLDTAYQFYWENGDKIYVKKNGSWKASSALSLTERQTFSKFIVNETFTAAEPSVDVLYVGQNGTASGASASVTISATQSETAWNSAVHLGRSGDCGKATATRDNLTGSYTFMLEHQASYLIFYPYLDSSLDGYKLTSIDIESENGTQIAGTFSFSTSGLASSATSGGTDKITLSLGASGVGLPLQNTVPTTKANGNHCYAVIHPGSHKLRVTYHVVSQTNADDRFYVEQSLAVGGNARTFNPNGVSIITYRLAPREYELGVDYDYYQWGARDIYLNTYPSDYDTSTDAPTQLTMTSPVNWAGLPNANELHWYIVNGDPRWDKETEWYLKGDPTPYTGGIWMKKKRVILANAGGSMSTCSHGLTFCPEHDEDGVDRRSVFKQTNRYDDAYTRSGRPADNVIGDYFFLPAMSYLEDAGGSIAIANLATNGLYWSRSPNPDDIFRAYALHSSNSFVYSTSRVRNYGGVVTSGWFR